MRKSTECEHSARSAIECEHLTRKSAHCARKKIAVLRTKHTPCSRARSGCYVHMSLNYAALYSLALPSPTSGTASTKTSVSQDSEHVREHGIDAWKSSRSHDGCGTRDANDRKAMATYDVDNFPQSHLRMGPGCGAPALLSDPPILPDVARQTRAELSLWTKTVCHRCLTRHTAMYAPSVA
jgi:hypothetical protein